MGSSNILFLLCKGNPSFQTLRLAQEAKWRLTMGSDMPADMETCDEADMFMPMLALPAGAGEANMSNRSADPEDGAGTWD